MTEFELIITGALSIIISAVGVKYYRQLRKAQKEYEKAKEVVGDIILSFNRQFKQEADRLELVAYKVEAAFSRSDKALKRAEELDKRVQAVESKVCTDSDNREQVVVKLDDLDKKLHTFATSHDVLATKISALEEQTRQFSFIPEAKIEAVIPIKREKALAPLTETELSVLEMLSVEGSKTAPEIKERIKLSREHTARLMKKLYEAGYLERDSSKIPFKYGVKKEMERLLKKPEKEVA